ncbi:MAG: 4-alpha-glucanotransferase [Rikenellaceae bacterium]
MKIRLKTDYRTNHNEVLEVVVDNKSYPLKNGAIQSEKIVDIHSQTGTIEYRYRVGEKEEWGKPHTLTVGENVEQCLVVDRWQDMPKNSPFYTSLFTQSVFKRVEPKCSVLEENSVVVAVNSPIVEPSQTVVMVGSAGELGSWSVKDGVKMCDSKFPLWLTPSLPKSDALLSAEFKFVIVDTLTGDVVAWEEGENRTLCSLLGEKENSIQITLTQPIFSLPLWRGAGVAIPVFSLRSENSMGVGDFMDLKKMVDWAAITKQKIIQILPINDTTMTHTWQDSYPYNANSIFALHPQYIAPTKVGILKDSKLQKEYEAKGAELNALESIDYEAVTKLKNNYMQQLYSEIGEEQLSSEEFKAFFKKNSYWLEPYALFSLLRDKYLSVEFSAWGKESLYSEELMAEYRNDHFTELGYYYYVQYNLHLQLVEVREYAQTKNVVFKGDIPIGVSRTSVDVWVSPELFHLNSQAGAPPDDFSIMGQNWGFPTYNWAEMAKDGYSWWNRRFKKMAEYFDAYRIDHILGFFRIWEIPLDAVHGLLGHFSPSMPFSVDEMRNNYGFYFEKSYCTSSINDWIVDEFFKEDADKVRAKYLDSNGDGTYTLKPQFDSQTKIKAHFNGKETPFCTALMSLLNEVLFIEDPYQKEHYHPRISAQNSYKFRAMNDYDKERFNALYNHFYYHRHNDFWYKEAMAKLPALVRATEMLTCGEDLGMIPDCVPAVMDSEQILSLEIQRMPKNPQLEFGEPYNYPYRAVCTTSTHDMNPLRAWLLEDFDTSNRYARQMLGIDCDIVNESMNDIAGIVCEAILEQHLHSPAMWTILPLQDWLSMDEKLRNSDPNSERINVPANSRHYWRYRMHLTIEKLITQDNFNSKLRAMIGESWR